MRYATFAVDYAEFKTFVHEVLAVQHGLLHGAGAPAVYSGTAIVRGFVSCSGVA